MKKLMLLALISTVTAHAAPKTKTVYIVDGKLVSAAEAAIALAKSPDREVYKCHDVALGETKSGGLTMKPRKTN